MAGPFDFESTTEDVLADVRLDGKRILVTGVSAGLGVETARALAAHGAQVTGTARDLDKARTATAGLAGEIAKGGGSLALEELDLASLASVRACADRLAGPFDVVIANAGVMACPFGKTADGFETQFGANHLGHFVLANRLATKIRDAGRVVMLSSAAHHFSDIDLDDPNFERTPYGEFKAYGRSKTANSLFAVEFDRRHSGRGVRAASVHPGGISTELGRHMRPEIWKQIAAPGLQTEASGRPVSRRKSIPQGAATSVWAAIVASGEAVGGRYCEDCHVAEVVEHADATRGGVRAYALDPVSAAKLWAKSEEMVGERF